MEIITNKIEMKKDLNKYFKTDNICFLDIETLGFSRQHHNIYLIGLVYYSAKEKSWVIDQLFINSLDKEKELLLYLNDILDDFDLIVTYNGDSFDIPFIRERYKKYKIKNNIEDIKTYDIYREIRKNGKYLGLENLKLKTIERYLGIYRQDEFTGGDCIDIYLEYVDTGDKKLKEFVLMHNYEDLYYLTDILDILDHIEEKIGFSIRNYKFKIDSFNLKKESIDIKLLSNRNLNIAYYGDNFSIRNIEDNSYNINLELKQGYVAENTICQYFDMNNLDDYIVDSTDYNLPPNILVIDIEKKEVMENIKNLIEDIFKKIV